MYDVIIVGGGPAGLTAALYTARRSLRTLIISKDIGGQAATTTLIENYPGVGAIDGFELMERFKQQAMENGAEFKIGEVHRVARKSTDSFIVHYNEEQVETRTVLLAFGLTPRSLDIPGEEKFIGKGVTFSTGEMLGAMHNKIAVVVGGGNSAIESVNLLAAVAKKVYLVHRRNRFRAEEALVRKLETHSNVEQLLNSQLTEISGTTRVTGVTVRSEAGASRQLNVDGVFINVGFMSKTDLVEAVVDLNEKNEVIIESDCSTKTPGIFAAGDITIQHYKQVIVSAGEGCKAALACYTYIMQKDGKEIKADQDWKVSSEDHFIRT